MTTNVLLNSISKTEERKGGERKRRRRVQGPGRSLRGKEALSFASPSHASRGRQSLSLTGCRASRAFWNRLSCPEISLDPGPSSGSRKERMLVNEEREKNKPARFDHSCWGKTNLF